MTKKEYYKWHAVYVKSRAEKKVLDEIVQKEIIAYLPLLQTKKQWSDRVKIVEEPLLTGYVFVKVGVKEYAEVLKTNGVVGYVSFSGKAAEIPDKQMQDLRLFLEKANSCIQVSSENIQKGQRVKVVAGVLAGLEGEIAEIRGKKRIVLRFESLGCAVFADVSLELIESLDPMD